MIKVADYGFHEVLRILHLDNGDEIYLTEREFQDVNAGELDEYYVFYGLNSNYTGVFGDTETTDDVPDLLGFEKA